MCHPNKGVIMSFTFASQDNPVIFPEKLMVADLQNG